MIQEGVIGTSIILDIRDEVGDAVDVSGASTKQIKLLSPSGTGTTYSAVNVTDGTDGKIKYVTTADDIDETGLWHVQGRIVDGSADRWTSVATFTVAENL